MADAGQRMMDWEKEHDTEISTLKKITIGLGAGTAGALLPGKVLTKLVGAEGIAATEAISKIFSGAAGKAIADRAVRATYGGGAMAGFSVIENAFEKFGYNSDRELTQGVLESLILGTAVSGIHSEIGLARKRMAERGESKRLDEYFKTLTLDLNDALNEANRVRTEYGGGAGAVIGEVPAEAKPVLDQYGRPVGQEPIPTVSDRAGQEWRYGEPIVPGEDTLPPDVQTALKKQPLARNAQEKLLADQARKDKGVTGVTWGAPAEWPEIGRAQTGEEIIDRLQRAVDIIGEPNAAKKLNDVLTLNQGDIVNAFRAPGGAPGIPEITDRITELAYKVEDTGDPGAAKELSSFIQSNIGALKGFPRWPVARITPEAPIGTSATAAEVIAAAPEAAPIPGAPRPSGADMVTRPAAPVALAGRSNVTPTPPEAVALSESPAPKATPPLEPPSSAPARAGGGRHRRIIGFTCR